MDLGRPHLEKFSGFKHAKQAHLGGQGQLRHFVQENRAAVGFFEVALSGFRRPRERPFLVAKQLRIDGSFWDGTAVHGHVRPVFPGAELVHDPGHGLLSCPAFPQDKHADVRGCHLGRHRKGSVERRRIPHDAKPTLQRTDIHG